MNHIGDRKIDIKSCKDRDTSILGGGERLRWNLLALCVVILNQVLEEVHSLLGLDLIYFDQVLQKKERSRVQPGGEIQGVFKGFLVV